MIGLVGNVAVKAVVFGEDYISLTVSVFPRITCALILYYFQTLFVVLQRLLFFFFSHLLQLAFFYYYAAFDWRAFLLIAAGWVSFHRRCKVS